MSSSNAAETSRTLDSDDALVELAEHHVEARLKLYETLSSEREKGGVSVPELATHLGVEEAVVRSIEAGEINLTLTDLSEYLTAIGSLIHFSVFPNWVEEHSPLKHEKRVVSFWQHKIWKETAPDHLDAERLARRAMAN